MAAGDLIDDVRATFGLDPAARATLTPGGRGALGRISRLETDPAGTSSRSCSTTRPRSRR